MPRARARAARLRCRGERVATEPSSALISSSQGAAGAHWPRLGAVRGDVAGRPGVRGGLSVDALSWEVLLNWASCCMCSCAASRSERCVRAGQSATGGHGDGGARDSRRGDDLVAHRRRSSGAGNERPVQRSACRGKRFRVKRERTLTASHKGADESVFLWVPKRRLDEARFSSIRCDGTVPIFSDSAQQSIARIGGGKKTGCLL